MYAPALHGHAAAISPCNPREIIIFGGRGGIEWFDHVYLLKLPPPHNSGMTYPNMPTAKRGVQEKLAIDRTASSSHPDEVGRNNIVIDVPKAIIQWEILSEVTFDRSNGATAPPALRYGHVMVASHLQSWTQTAKKLTSLIFMKILSVRIASCTS